MDEVKRGELYYADLSPVVGSEQGGIRPVLILQNDKTNKNSTTTIVAAMTSQIKNNLQTHVKVSGHGLKKESLVLLEQIRTIDKVRLMQYIGRLGDKDMKKIDRALTGISAENFVSKMINISVCTGYIRTFAVLLCCAERQKNKERSDPNGNYHRDRRHKTAKENTQNSGILPCVQRFP